MPEVSIYEQLGGEPAIAAVVDSFYERVLDDPSLAPFFAGIDMDRLRRHQTMFIAAATGGPAAPLAFDLAATHHPLGIADADFERVVDHLVTALRLAGAGTDAIEAVVATLAPLRPQIVDPRTSRSAAIGAAG